MSDNRNVVIQLHVTRRGVSGLTSVFSHSQNLSAVVFGQLTENKDDEDDDDDDDQWLKCSGVARILCQGA